MHKVKAISYILVFVFLFSCKSDIKTEKLIVDAGSFLDDTERKNVEERLSAIDKKGVYHLFLYTVIAEKYYSHQDYDKYVFWVIGKNDTISNKNILLYLSYDDKKIRIHTGNKAREILTDSLSQEAINRLVPYLSQRNYYQGIKAVINYIDSVFAKTKY